MSSLRTSRRARRDQDPTRVTVARALAVSTLVVVVVFFAMTSYNGVPGRDYKTLYVSTPQVGNLIGHDPVRIGGVRVGQVLSTEIEEDGRARVELQIEPGTELPTGTRVRIRANGLLGARYVELRPGAGASPMRDGSVIRAGREELTYGVPDVLDTFDPATRTALTASIDQLGAGVLSRGSGINRAIGAVDPALPQFRSVIDTVLAREGAAARLLPSLERGVTPLDDNRRALAAMFDPLAASLMPFVDRREATRELLEQAPSALAAADTGLRAGVPLLRAARSVADGARRTLAPAPASLRAAIGLLRDGAAPVRRTAGLLDEAGRTVPHALTLTRNLRPLLPQLEAMGDDLVPVLQKVAARGCEVINFGVVFRSMTGFGGGAGSGPLGPGMAFRLQAYAPAPLEVVHGDDTSPVRATRDGYPAPCKYLSGPYESTGVRIP